MTALPSGIWRHHRGHLYQVLFGVELLGGGNPGSDRAGLEAVDATNGSRCGSRLYVSNGWAWPVEPDEITMAVRAVVYVGVTLEGEPKPGPRLRVREEWQFVEPVVWPDGEIRPRFEFVGPCWPPEHPDNAAARDRWEASG